MNDKHKGIVEGGTMSCSKQWFETFLRPIFMTFVKRALKKSNLFDQVIVLRLYNSWYGLRTKRYSIISPIIHVDENLNYDTTQSLVEHVHKQIKKNMNSDIDVVHLLGHSMGGLVLRSFLKSIIIANPDGWLYNNNSPSIGSMLQLATPNQGTEITSLRLVNWIGQLRMAHYLHKFGHPS